jgi:hypothetical protein
MFVQHHPSIIGNSLVENQAGSKEETQSGSQDNTSANDNNNSDSGSNGSVSLNLREKETLVIYQSGKHGQEIRKDLLTYLLTYFTYSSQNNKILDGHFLSYIYSSPPTP